MSYLVKYSTLAIMLAMFTLILISACSSNQRYACHVNGGESYLHTHVHDLKTPAGIILPLHNGYYDVPNNVAKGALGKEMDICPPHATIATKN